MHGIFRYEFPAGSNRQYVFTQAQLALYFAQDGRCGDCNVSLDPLNLIEPTAGTLPAILTCVLCLHRKKRIRKLPYGHSP